MIDYKYITLPTIFFVIGILPFTTLGMCYFIALVVNHVSIH